MTVLDIRGTTTSKQASASPLNRMNICLAYFHNSVLKLTLLYRGIYVPDNDRWPARFRGIGIRTEDSVCVGDDNPIVLTPEAAKEASLTLSSPLRFAY